MINSDTFVGPSFSIYNRFFRFCWKLIYFTLFKYSPRFFHSWRILILIIFGAKIGKGVHVYPKVEIWAPWNLIIGDESGIANGVILYTQDKIIIGKRVVISQGSHLCTGTHNFNKKGFPLITKPITIGDQAWIAAEVFIHPGIVIGNGAVIGSRSVVTKNMASWMVCSGFPCVELKKRVIEF
jgi:putative colanic acid biosynthesis acetyltransferase WcaF